MNAAVPLQAEHPAPARRPAGMNSVFNDAIPREVRASQADPRRLCPVVAGTAVLDGDRLTVRTAGRDVEVSAPHALLAEVAALCDGTRTLTEVLEQAAADRAEDLRGFLPFLLAQGALVDANLLVLHAAAYAHQGSPFGVVAPSRVTNELCRRFLWNPLEAPDAQPPGTRHVDRVPLSAFYEARVSTYTFDNRPVTERSLLQLLWSVAGVVHTQHERVGYVTPKRTLASAGGMHLLQLFVALCRPVGAYAPGVYRVSYPAEKAVHLALVQPGSTLLPRAFGKPWELEYASGAVFIAADGHAAAMRYRNRSVQYLFMEAGAALHNAGLTAPQLGMGFATIGGYYESVVARLCDLGDELVLGAGIFGATPTRSQVENSLQALDLEFTWVNGGSDRYALPFHLASARVRTPDDERPHTWGRDTDPRMAYIKAAAEAVEREGFRQPRGLSTGRLDALANAIDPRSFVRYSDAQYAQPTFPFARFDDGLEYCWTEGTDLATGQAVHVLAELVFSRASIAAAGNFAMQRPYTQVTSSGCAAGVSREDATYRALLEVVERDAFMRHWLAQAPGEQVAASDLPPAFSERMQALQAAGCRVEFQRLSSPWAHVCLVAVQHRDLHFTAMGTSAHPDFDEALSCALQETEARAYAWLHGHRPQVEEPEQVASPEHHFELYGRRRYYRRADRVLFPARPSAAEWPVPLAEGLPALLGRMTRARLQPLVVDITPANASIDQGRTSLHAVKALVPALLPMSFGFHREPLGMASSVHPLATFPHPFP